VGKERRRRKDVRIAAKVVVVNELMAIFHA